MALQRSYLIYIISKRCKECGLCINICPKDILRAGSEININGYHFTAVSDPGLCIGCKLCEYICPEYAIYVSPSESESRVMLLEG